MEYIRSIVESPCDSLPVSVLVVETGGGSGPRGIVQLVHGMAEHKERYTEFMEFLAELGFVCVIHDHRGHGQSVRSRKDLGYFYDNGFECLVKDTLEVSKYAKSLYPGLPLYLVGHSMGSLVVRSYVKRYDSRIDGLIVIGSPSKHRAARFGLFLTRLVGKLRGERYVSRFIYKLAAPKARKPAFSESAWICSDKNVVMDFDADELCGFMFTVNGYEALMRLILDVYGRSGWRIENPNLPIHFASGAEDVCLIDEKRFFEAVSFMKEVGYVNVTSKLYDGLYHEILNEVQKREVFNDLADVLSEMEKTYEVSASCV